MMRSDVDVLRRMKVHFQEIFGDNAVSACVESDSASGAARADSARATQPTAEGHVGTPDAPFVFASAPGRVELAGNHTDHQGGCTISAAIDRRIYALARPNTSRRIRMHSKGYGMLNLDCADLDARVAERGTSLSLLRGMAASYVRDGGTLCGFDAVVESDIPVGAGLSSSAAFEVLVGAMIRAVCKGGSAPARVDPAPLDPVPVEPAPVDHAPVDPAPLDLALFGAGSFDLVSLALEGASVERERFGKPCGVQDQLACALGGISAFDFAQTIPQVTPIEFDWDASGYSLCLVNSACDHSAYTAQYAAVPTDMFAVAQYLGCERLVQVPFDEFLSRLPAIRAEAGDRATLRAMHFFEENKRVAHQRQALEKGDVATFLDGARRSGASSAQFLQNVAPASTDAHTNQSALVVLALCEYLLDGRGACRIHGGGFGGSVLAFVPTAQAEDFERQMNDLIGYQACLPVLAGARGVHAERLGA